MVRNVVAAPAGDIARKQRRRLAGLVLQDGYDLVDGSLTWDYQYVEGGNVVLPNGWEDEEWNRVSYFIREDDPLSATVRVGIESVHRRGPQGRFHITSEGQMTCDATTFFVEDTVEVCEGEEGDERRVFSRTWRHEEPRDLV